MENISEGIEPAQTAERYLMLKNNAITIGNQSIAPRMSIGIAVYPQDGSDVDTLLRAADTAMYSAKRHAKHRFAFHDPKMTRDIKARLELESDLQNALRNNGFELVYQPKVSLDDGLVMGVEALLR